MAALVSAIIPAHNEADIISDTVRAVLSIPTVGEIIVVDDGSTDCTAAVAESAGAHRAIVLERNSGKGGAMNEAVALARGEVLLLLDADLGASAAEAVKLLTPVLADEVDMAVALFSRTVTAGPVEPRSPKLAARSGGFGLLVGAARLGIRMLTGKWVASPLAGPRALKREIVEKAGGFAPRFGVEVGLTVDALRMGYRVTEVPVAMVHRPSGRSLKGFVHRGMQLADVLTTLARKALIEFWIIR